MTSKYKVIQKRPYRERAQPKRRKRFGILEKHKDYILRARDYNIKKKKLRALKQKASLRNPDEFYFRMLRKPKEKRYTPEQLISMKTQDINYVVMKETQESKKIEKLTENFNYFGSEETPKNKHTIFVDSKEEAENFEPTKYFDTTEEGLKKASNRPKLEMLKTQDLIVNKSLPPLKSIKKEMKIKFSELAQRINREKQLRLSRENLELQKKLMGKGKRKKIRDGENGMTPVYKWKRIRKK